MASCSHFRCSTPAHDPYAYKQLTRLLAPTTMRWRLNLICSRPMNHLAVFPFGALRAICPILSCFCRDLSPEALCRSFSLPTAETDRILCNSRVRSGAISQSEADHWSCWTRTDGSPACLEYILKGAVRNISEDQL